MATKRGTSKWLRYLVNIWTIILFVVILLDFGGHNGYEKLIGPTAAVYTGALVVYSAEKEFERWAEFYEGRHPGEMYVIAWTVLMFFLISASLIVNTEYHIPSEIISTYIAVISIMAFTQKSKSFFKSRRK